MNSLQRLCLTFEEWCRAMNAKPNQYTLDYLDLDKIYVRVEQINENGSTSCPFGETRFTYDELINALLFSIRAIEHRERQ